MNFIKELIYRLRGDFTTEKLVSMGMKVGTNFKRLHGVILDPGHCWLIDIGNNVTMAPRVHILCHDASTKTFLNYTKIFLRCPCRSCSVPFPQSLKNIQLFAKMRSRDQFEF